MSEIGFEGFVEGDEISRHILMRSTIQAEDFNQLIDELANMDIQASVQVSQDRRSELEQGMGEEI